jgi:hypothetical protein
VHRCLSVQQTKSSNTKELPGIEQSVTVITRTERIHIIAFTDSRHYCPYEQLDSVHIELSDTSDLALEGSLNLLSKTLIRNPGGTYVR